MSPAAQNIITQINAYVTNYALTAFTNYNLNRILQLITQLADTNSAAGAGNAAVIPVTSANFVAGTAAALTDCPLPSLVNNSIRVYYGEAQKFLEQDAGEWQPLPGGGFRVLIANFDASQANYHFYVYVSTS